MDVTYIDRTNIEYMLIILTNFPIEKI